MQNQKPPPQCTVLVACKIRSTQQKVPAWPEPLRGLQEEGGRFASMGEKSRFFFAVVEIYVVGKRIDSERDGL